MFVCADQTQPTRKYIHLESLVYGCSSSGCLWLVTSQFRNWPNCKTLSLCLAMRNVLLKTLGNNASLSILHSSVNTFPCHSVGCYSFFLLESSKSCSSTSDRDFSLVKRTRRERRAHFHSRNSTEQVAIHCYFYLFSMLGSFMVYSHNETFFISITHAKKYGTVVHVFSLRFKHCQSTHICWNEFYIQERVSPYLIFWVDVFVRMHTATKWTTRTWTWPSDI